MTSIVKQLEAAIVAALNAALDPDGAGNSVGRVSGFRQSVAEGLVKTSDGDGRPEVLVAVSPATSQSYGSHVVEFDVSVSVRLDWADDPTIAAFDEAAALVERQFMRWNAQGGIADMSAALSTENFRADGFKLAGGTDSAEVSGDRSSVSTTFGFAVMGVYQETETPNTHENQGG